MPSTSRSEFTDYRILHQRGDYYTVEGYSDALWWCLDENGRAVNRPYACTYGSRNSAMAALNRFLAIPESGQVVYSTEMPLAPPVATKESLRERYSFIQRLLARWGFV